MTEARAKTPATAPKMSQTLFASALACSGAILAIVACSDDKAASSDAPPAADASSDVALDTRPPPTRSEFGLEARPPNPTCIAPPRPPSTASIKVERVYANLTLNLPLVATQRPNDGSRWYIARRGGELAYFASNSPTSVTVSVDLKTIPGGPGFSDDGEGGFLGFVFHPNFAQNGKAYVSFTAPPTAGGFLSSVVAEIASSDGGDTFGGYKELLRFEQTTDPGHKGGGLAITRDGYLYASFGDGGGADDTYVNGQSTTGYFAKVIRFAVDGAATPEIYARGFRNPFRISVDRDRGDLWVGDVGQNEYEEIDKVKQGGNYGWPCREGNHDDITTPPNCPSMANLLPPVVEIPHAPGTNTRSITGGVVYRGKAMPSLVGNYIFGDYKKHDLLVLSIDPGTGAATATSVAGSESVTASWVGFGEDVDGEVYGLSLEDSRMYKIVPAATTAGTPFPDRLSKTGCKDASGLIPYGVNMALWSDGAEKSRAFAIPDGKTIHVSDGGHLDLPIGSVIVKSFALGGKPVETRLLVRHDDGEWAGYSYEWLDDGSDAVLLPGSKTKQVGAQTWYYPSRGDCPACHTEVAGRTLGPVLGQLNGDFVYGQTNLVANQLKTLDHIGIFDQPLGKPVDQIEAYPSLNSSAPASARARAYLHANCAHCHQDSGPGKGDWDLRYSLSFKDTGICNGQPGDSLGISGAKLLVPGDPTKSLISVRPHATTNRMPPLASSIVDTEGLSVVDAWITSLTSCP